jgi:hypothetical protein
VAGGGPVGECLTQQGAIGEHVTEQLLGGV